MTDHNVNASSLPRPTANTRSLVRSSITRSSGSYASYDAGESSKAPSPTYDMSIDGASFDTSTSPSQRLTGQSPDPNNNARRRHLYHKPRPSSGFLLPDSNANESDKPRHKHRTDDRRRSRIPVDSRKGKGKSPLRSSDDSKSNFLTPANKNNNGREDDDTHVDRTRSQMGNRRTTRIPSLRPSSAPLDVDSTQIVSMALDLSESRRLASRRNITTPMPPRLAQLPDSTPGGSLKQHLQQQRRTSRNISPRADMILTPRIVSSPRLSTPLQSTFDPDSSYTYQFSSSTLNRAQRAKEYLELMAQYRRLLLFLPPLKQEAHTRPSTSNTTASPNSASSPHENLASSPNRPLGRVYNPLQYIRNRKIRTRERKIIDGEVQGFGDVPRVTDWIDEMAASTAALPMSESSRLPSFPSADGCLGQQQQEQHPATNLSRPVTASTKLKRTRFEWSIDPADMLADIYWLEQGNNRYLIEDRNYAKIFTPKVDVYQPSTQANEPSKPSLIKRASKEVVDGKGHNVSEHDAAHSTKADRDIASTSSRGRARQKLQEMRGTHHKHNNSTYSHHDFLKFKRASSLDSSDSESDRRRRGRTGSISANGKDLLEKQMNEMLAKETQGEEMHALAREPDIRHLKPLPAGLGSPVKTSSVSRQDHARKDSHTEAPKDAAEQFETTLPNLRMQASPIRSGRASLEVPGYRYRSSADLDAFRPVFSDPRSKGQHNGYVPAIGMDLSPNVSRPSSPARNPFSKVKNMFRDRSRDRDSRENDEKTASPIDPSGTLSLSAVGDDVVQPSNRPRSKSSSREFPTSATYEHHHKSRRSMGSFGKADEQVGLRTILKGGAKLDDMIRGGVSKVTDLIWKRDSDDSSAILSDDSDSDDSRGRRREPALLSPESSVLGRRPVKNYLDVMPNFKSAISSMDKSPSHDFEDSSAPVVSRPPSRSPRFDQLKPPRIEIGKISPISSDVEQNVSGNVMDSDTSEIDSSSRPWNHPATGPRQTSMELQKALFIHPPKGRPEDGPYISEHRHWTIPDRAAVPQNVIVSRREVARIRTLIICSGIKALEISRRSNDCHPLYAPDSKAPGLPLTAKILSHTIDDSIQSFEKHATGFLTETAPVLQQRVDDIHDRVAMEFMDMTRRAVDEADEVSHDIVDSQRLKVKSVVDTMDKMLRQRRRRFRWVRRAGWLAVEWVLVGIMWYVWFIVKIFQTMAGAGRAVASVFRWLFWLSP